MGDCVVWVTNEQWFVLEMCGHSALGSSQPKLLLVMVVVGGG